ncbi:alkaline phosphatase family protein [Marinilongibacter aquaticus]|uniref:alkaline phosphatase family protein n=1 Tax=Marinilongibacter aquaticus TaxID=2975157 RepID=UPI0021BDED7E|nr:alkaline phosphatase family protein [Marinilongibacter aquaticus]UBM58539.1 alkaline phosphatase family protein [Marinilongibacter aquaticus]
MKYTLIFFLVSISVLAQKHKTLVVLVDGIPFDVIEKVSTPNLDAIASDGGFAAAYVGGEKGGVSESPTISAVGYNSMLTGTWANKHNVWGNGIKAPNYAYPTFFQLARAAKPALTLGIFSTWEDNRTKLLGENKAETNHLHLDVKFDGYEKDTVNFPHDANREYIKNIDELVVSKAVESLKGKEAPDISWVYLEYTDDMGHKFGDSPQFYDAVSFEDHLIGNLYETIREREKSLGEEWLVVVTTDHGRSEKDGKGHGGQSARERKTWIVTNQNGLNTRFKSGLAVVDILPSVCRFMDIEIPQEVAGNLDGQSFLK